MFMRHLLILGLCMATTPVAFGGFIATTGNDAVNTPAGSVSGPQVGDIFSTAGSGTLTSFTPLTPQDQQITGGDLSHYRYDLSGTVTSVNLALGDVTYAGTYDIYYDLNSDGVKDGSDPFVSQGTFTILAQFISGTNNASLNGSLIQTVGPAAPFADLSYGGNPVVYVGSYTGDNPGVSGHISGTLIQAAAATSGGAGVPEPASLGILGLGAVAMLSRRRAR